MEIGNGLEGAIGEILVGEVVWTAAQVDEYTRYLDRRWVWQFDPFAPRAVVHSDVAAIDVIGASFESLFSDNASTFASIRSGLADLVVSSNKDVYLQFDATPPADEWTISRLFLPFTIPTLTVDPVSVGIVNGKNRREIVHSSAGGVASNCR